MPPKRKSRTDPAPAKIVKREFIEKTPPVPRGWFTESQRDAVVVLWGARVCQKGSFFHHEYLPRDLFIAIVARIPDDKDIARMYSKCMNIKNPSAIAIGRELARLMEMRNSCSMLNKKIARVYYHMGDVEYTRRIHDAANSYIKIALTYAGKDDDPFKHQCYTVILFNKAASGDWEGVDDCVKRLRELHCESNKKEIEFDIESTVIEKSIREEKYAEALLRIDASLERIKNEKFEGYQRIVGNMMLDKSRCLMKMKKWNDLNEICKIQFHENEYPASIRNRFLWLAMSHCMLGNVEDALDSATKAQTEANSSKIPYLIEKASSVLRDISGVFSGRLDKEKIKWELV